MHPGACRTPPPPPPPPQRTRHNAEALPAATGARRLASSWLSRRGPGREEMQGEALQLRSPRWSAVACAPGHLRPSGTRPDFIVPSPEWPTECHPTPRSPRRYTRITATPLTPPECNKAGLIIIIVIIMIRRNLRKVVVQGKCLAASSFANNQRFARKMIPYSLKML